MRTAVIGLVVVAVVALLQLMGCAVDATSMTTQELCNADRDSCPGWPAGLTKDYTASRARSDYPQASPAPLGVNVTCSRDDAGNPYCSVYLSLPGGSKLFFCTSYPSGLYCGVW